MLKHLDEITAIGGWMEPLAMTFFDVINTIQIQNDIHGHIMEIGTYYGKSAAVLGQFLRTDEEFYCCDTFSGYKKVENNFRDSFETFFYNMTGRKAIVRQMMSTDLTPELLDNQKFRIWHIDGYHSFEDTLFDLKLGTQMLGERGIIIADDFLNPDWLGVGQAINEFLRTDDYCLIAQGYNKTILARKVDYQFYYDAIKNNEELPYSPHNFLPFHGFNYLSMK